MDVLGDIIIEPGATIIFQQGSTATVENLDLAEGGSLSLKAGASVIVNGDVTLSSNSTVSVTLQQGANGVFQVLGNATIQGSLVVTLSTELANNLRDSNTLTVPLVTGSSTTGTFDSIQVSTDQPCEEVTTTQQTTSRDLSLVFNLDRSDCNDSTLNDPNAFPLWAIAIIVVAALAIIAGIIIAVAITRRRKMKNSERSRVRMSVMGSRPTTTEGPSSAPVAAAPPPPPLDAK
jgi:hypothetical protein